MRLFNSLFVLFALSISIGGCKKGLFEKAGKVVVSERPVGSFIRIYLFSNINLILTQDTVNKIKIEAGENLQDGIITAVADSNLTIKNGLSNLANSPNETINVYVSVKDLQVISYQGAGDITCTNTIKALAFNILSNEGAGNVYLSLDTKLTIAGIYDDDADFIFSGKSDSCYSYCASRGTIDFKDFTVKRMQMDYSSARDAYVHATELLRAKISYKGNVFYKGGPIIDVQLKNEGRLLPL